MMVHQEDFKMLEKAFGEIQEKKNVDTNLRSIERILSRINDGMTFSVTIVENPNNKFYGMTVFPERSVIEDMVIQIIDEKPHLDLILERWKDNNRWYIEIDSMLLYDKNLNANPAEIVAVLLHEMGHVIYSNTIPQKVNRNIRYNIMSLDFTLKKLVAHRKVRTIFALGIAEACAIKNFRYINLQKERVADKYVVKMGYGDALNNLFDKVIQAYGTRLINRPEAEVDADINTLTVWALDNISELEFRKKKLKTSLQSELMKNKSPYLRDLIEKVRWTFFGDAAQDQYKEMVAEQALVNVCRTVAKEAFFDFFDKKGKVKKVSQAEIDELSIEIDRIANSDDKIYILDRIYDKMDLIDAGLKCYDDGQPDKAPQTRTTLLSTKKTLEDMRAKVVAYPIKDKQYGLFIKYPKGYEG